ncbi:MAG: hypothetical protein AAF483_09665, partial [Planctomycetota bacterium]
MMTQLKHNWFSLILLLVFSFGLATRTQQVRAEVAASAADGFVLVIKKQTRLDADMCFEAFVQGFGRWWDASHSYSNNAKSMRVDVDKSCILERLPGGGYVRHMEMVYYDPEKNNLRFTGGLGPLQEMGVSGAMSLKLTKVEGKGTEIELKYSVTGASILNLK